MVVPIDQKINDKEKITGKTGKRRGKEDEEVEKILGDKIYSDRMIDSETAERISEETIIKSPTKLTGPKHWGPTLLFHRVSVFLF